MKKQFLKILLLTLITFSFSTNLESQVWNADANSGTWQNYFRLFQSDRCSGSINASVTTESNVDGTTGKSWKIRSPRNVRRAEFSRTTGTTQNFTHNRNKNYYYSWRWRIDSDVTINSDVTVFQWKTENNPNVFGSDGSQNYPINMEYKNGQLKLYYFAPCEINNQFSNWGNCKKSNGSQEFPSARRMLLKSVSVAENEWVDIVLRIQRGENESGTGAGRVQLWINGSLQSLTGPNGTGNSITLKTDDANNNSYNNDTVYPKWGVYNNASCSFDITTWIHNLKIYDNATAAVNNLKDSSPNEGSINITGSWYRLRNAQTSRYMNGNGENVGTSTSSSGNDKQFRFIKQGDFYNIDIRNTSGTGTGIMRTVTSENKLKITNLSPRNNSDKLYDIVQLSDGRYSIKATNSGKFLQNNTSNTVTLTVNAPSSNNRAKWQFIRVGAEKNVTGKSIEDIDTSKTVLIFPNPANSFFNIDLKGFTQANVEIADILGKIVYKTTTSNNKIQLTKDSTFTPGLYIIRVTDTQNKIFINKLVIK